MKRIISFVLCIVMCAAVLCSCGGDTANVFDKDIYAVTDRIASDFNFDDAVFYKDTDEYAKDTLMYMYGVEDEAVLDSIEKFTFCTPGTNSAKTFAMLLFKEGTAADTIDAAEKAIRDVYLANLITTTAVYDITQSEIADKATFVKYDNALVLIAYDAAGNTDVINAINE